MAETGLSARQRRLRLAGTAAAAALIAGSVTGTLSTMRDEAWPGRGGMEAVFQISLLFSAYCFVVTTAVGILLAGTLSPLMRRPGLGNPGAHFAVGLLVGLAIHLLVDLAIGERIDRAEDFLGGTLAGGAAGLIWWFAVQRHEQKAPSNG